MERLERQAVRLMVFRMVVALAFFLSALAIQTTVGAEISIQPFFYLIAFVLSANLCYAVAYWLLSTVRGRPGFLYLQLCGDAGAVTLLAFLTGGLTSVFTFLYHILIVVAGLLLKRRGAFTLAAADALLYGSLCVVQFYGWLSPDRFVTTVYDPPTPGAALYSLMAHLVGFLLVAALITAMASRQERSDATLGLIQKDLSLLRNLNDQIVSSIAGGLVTTDGEGRVTFANTTARRLLDETLPEGWNLMDRLAVLSGEERAPDLPDHGVRELRLALPGDRHLHIALSPLMDGALRTGYLALLRDETEMARMRSHFALRERLAAVGEMAANIAHEIKNPLGSISGAAQMLRRDRPAGTREDELLGIIQNESVRLSQTLDNFLRYVKPTPLKLRKVDLREVVQEVLTLYGSDPAVASGAVALEQELPGRPVEAEVDSDQVRQAVWNLLQNARKAVKEQGRVRVALSAAGPYAILEVRDTGVGMPKSELQKCFEPFQRGFSTGAGLGLSVVYRIMERHGGRVELDSRFGEGTVCTLFFPRMKDDG